ncbi:MAG: flagellar biosynthesis regulator FlaF [Acetobacteraceae bacterium]|jgi:flagellar protein FlaF|nr:flagellar biosynthesis regulator FlaF [Acetobacteraceae bacterium]
MSIARYAATMAATQGPREIEIRAFRYVNGLLAGVTEGDMLARVTALRKNFQLWSTLLSDLMLPTNPLPQDLKAQLASLSIWAQNESNRALFNDDVSLAPLISINRDMLEALEAQHRPAAGLPAAASPSPAAPPSTRTAPPAGAARSLAATA